LPASDADIFEHEPHELLSPLEVERVDPGKSLLCEAGDALVETVVGGQFGLAGDEGLAFLVEAARAGVDLS
jgi:hypothetical protein